MPKFNTIYDLYLEKAQHAINMSDIFLQKKWWLRNLKETWDVVENFIRDLLREFLPRSRFRIVTWYIASSQNIENNEQLYQCDVIIADESIPSIAILWNWIEIVPKEAVCGIIEIKRSLTNLSQDKPYIKAIDHLNTIISSTWITKDDWLNTLPWAIECWWMMKSWFRTNPLVWIIALKNWYKRKTYIDKLLMDTILEIESTNSLLDFVRTLDWTSLMTNSNWKVITKNYRERNDSWVRLDLANHQWNKNYVQNWDTSKVKVFARCIWFIIAYLSQTTWYPITKWSSESDTWMEWFFNKYFYNPSIK